MKNEVCLIEIKKKGLKVVILVCLSVIYYGGGGGGGGAPVPAPTGCTYRGRSTVNQVLTTVVID